MAPKVCSLHHKPILRGWIVYPFGRLGKLRSYLCQSTADPNDGRVFFGCTPNIPPFVSTRANRQGLQTIGTCHHTYMQRIGVFTLRLRTFTTSPCQWEILFGGFMTLPSTHKRSGNLFPMIGSIGHQLPCALTPDVCALDGFTVYQQRRV